MGFRNETEYFCYIHSKGIIKLFDDYSMFLLMKSTANIYSDNITDNKNLTLKIYTIKGDIYTANFNNVLETKFIGKDIYLIGYTVLTNI